MQLAMICIRVIDACSYDIFSFLHSFISWTIYIILKTVLHRINSVFVLSYRSWK